MEEVTNALTESLTDIATKIIISLGGGLIIGFIAGMAIFFVLRAISRVGAHVPKEAITKLSELIFAVVMMWSAFVIYTRVLTP